jgi:hypothetical protein
MRFSSAALLVLVLATAAAQRPGGGISPGGTRPGPPSLSNGNPFTRSNGTSLPGWGYRRWPPRLGNRLFFVVPPPIVPDLGYPPDEPYYPQPLPDEGAAFPQENVTQVPTTASPSLTDQDTHFNAVGSQPAGERCEISTTGSSEFHIYSAPGPPPSDNDDHPPLIALKNGWAYSVLKYWKRGKVFHFITTQGDQMQVPVTQVERIYPSSRQSHLTDPQSPPSK